MKITAITASVACLATSVLASGATINAALNNITAYATALNNAAAKWDGTVMGSIPILTASNNLIASINNGTNVAKASMPLSNTEAQSVYKTTQGLVTETNTTVTTFINQYPKIKAQNLQGVVEGQLNTTKQDVDKLSAAITSLVPASQKANANSATAAIDHSFALGLAKFAS